MTYKYLEEIQSVKLIGQTHMNREFALSVREDLGEENVDAFCADLKELCAFVARVSNPGNQKLPIDPSGLVSYLIRNSHWSPLDMADVILEIETARDIGRQALRHWSLKPQEFSQRYANPFESNLNFCLREARFQDQKNRQNSIVIDSSSHLHREWEEKQLAVLAAVEDAYKWATENHLAKEVARVVLPEGLTMSRLYFKGSVRSWLHYCSLRVANGTQKEHMLLADSCVTVIEKIFGDFRSFL